MSGIKKIWKVCDKFFGVIVPGITFITIFITFTILIISRYFFRTPVAWSYEVSVIAYMWTMFFGVGKAMDNDEHVVFGLVYDTLSPAKQCMSRIVYNIILVVLLLICLVPSYNALMAKKMVTGVLKLPYSFIFAPFIYMLVDIIIRSVMNIKKAYIEYGECKSAEGGKVE